MGNHDGKKKIIIGDDGVIERQDVFSLITIIFCITMFIVLIYLAIMMFIVG